MKEFTNNELSDRLDFQFEDIFKTMQVIKGMLPLDMQLVPGVDYKEDKIPKIYASGVQKMLTYHYSTIFNYVTDLYS